MKPIYMVAYQKLNNEWELYESGRNISPFVTFNISSAKAQATKLINKPYAKDASIIEVDIVEGRVFCRDRYGTR